ncbi:SDR family NAD(P)-dependent oxidoreductase [Streptomyces sp. NPDC005146]
MITGATSGLGRIAALELARRGYRIGAVARSRPKAERLLSDFRATSADVQTDIFYADLGLVSQARRVGEEIAAHYPRLDVLVNNAGLHAFSQRTTTEGFAEMTAVNYLGPFVLTETLTNTLVTSGPARIVNVASEAAKQARTMSPGQDLRHTAPYTRRESVALYGRTKLMTIMWTQELARRLDATKVTVNCCDPGFNATGLGRDLPGSRLLQRVLNTLKVGDPRKAPASSCAWRPIRPSRTPAEATSPCGTPSRCTAPSRAAANVCSGSCGRRRWRC